MTHEPTKHNCLSQKERVRRRIHTQIDQENYTFFPAKEPRDFFGESSRLSVAVYARVSTGNVEQTSSYELQKKYYEDYVRRHPNWTLARIYADEGISGTSLAHREQFHQMITDCKAGKIDLILTKSVSRFARNVVDCISTVRMLGELPSPVGVFFESECIFSLKEDSQMALSFQATMAQEESHTRSRSMETSLRMRLDGGLPLTPKLLGYSHDSEGNLVVNPREAPTVKLIFYLYLYGYSTSEIAEILTRQGRKTYLGNLRWTSNTVVQVLRNERHCGDVLTRKTFTPNYLTHKAKKNKGDRPQSLYRNHHEAIVSREDFIAVQHLLDNAKYTGEGDFPPIIKEKDFQMAHHKKESASTSRPTDEDIKLFKAVTHCHHCGKPMARRVDSRSEKPVTWKCSSCGYFLPLPDEDFKRRVFLLQQRLADKPLLAEKEEGELPVASMEARRLTNEIYRRLDSGNFSEDELVTLALQCAAENYQAIASTQHITERITAALLHAGPLSAFDRTLFERTVSEIHLTRKGEIILKLQNDVFIGEGDSP